MRPIKFRAWTGKDMNYAPWLGSAYGLNDGIEVAQKTGWVLMQFTGLKDKNGVEIYEGDIVIADGVERTIEFKDGAFTCANSFPSHTLKTGWIELEVIGQLKEKSQQKEMT